jgi:hypothetical protein
MFTLHELCPCLSKLNPIEVCRIRKDLIRFNLRFNLRVSPSPRRGEGKGEVFSLQSPNRPFIFSLKNHRYNAEFKKNIPVLKKNLNFPLTIIVLFSLYKNIIAHIQTNNHG